MTTGAPPRRVRANGPKIRQLRLNRFVNQFGGRAMSTADLAARCGVTRRAIQMIESGARPRPHERTMLAIARALNVSLATISLPEEEGP